jgi:erythromycin esterase
MTVVESKNDNTQDVLQWLKDNSTTIETLQAGNGFNDLELLRKIFEKAKIVVLREATHGTREFFQFKHRMIEFLVEKMGFSVFAIETG